MLNAKNSPKTPGTMLREIQAEYFGGLRERIEEIRERWEGISEERGPQKELRDLHRSVHTFTDESAAFGFPWVSQAAQQLELSLRHLIDGTIRPPGRDTALLIHRQLKDLQRASQRDSLDRLPDLEGMSFFGTKASQPVRPESVNRSCDGGVVSRLGKVLAIFFSRDRTENRRAQDALRRSEERYRTLYDSIPMMYFILDASGRVLTVNSYGAEQLGYLPDELVGQPVLTVFHPEDREAVSEQLMAALDNPGRVARWRSRKIRKDASLLWVQEAVRVVEYNGQAIALVVCEDVTERVEAEEELARYRWELRALTSELALAEERERRRIADGLHEGLGQLLATAKLRLGTLGEPGDSEPRLHAVEEIRALVDQALGNTRSLTFELSCPILYRLGLEPALRDLGERLGRQNGLRVDFSSDRRPKPLAEDLQVILFRVVRELLFNVIKHAQATTVRLRLLRTDREIRIAVEDDGVGFDCGELRRGPTAAGGIGLFSIRERLDHLGGRLEIGSAGNGGSRMVVTAPLDPPSETSV
ncbi:MAG: PAS domain S-box protein [bacterium]|nr:PAS domain S-box protein [bacterium]